MTAAKRGAASPSSDAARVCPNCGSESWATITLTADKTEKNTQAENQAAIDKVIAARGALLECRGCAYRTHASDALVPASA